MAHSLIGVPVLGELSAASRIISWITHPLRLWRTRKANESQTIRELIYFLEDRRVLWYPYAFEEREPSLASVENIRFRVAEALSSLQPKSVAIPRLRAIQSACRAFVTTMNYGTDTKSFHAALSILRQVIKQEMESLYREYKIEPGTKPAEWAHASSLGDVIGTGYIEAPNNDEE